MFPTLSHLLEYLFGVYIPLPIQTFGLLVAVAFFVAYQLFSYELKRKEKEGLLKPVVYQEKVGEPPSLFETIFNGLIGFVVGYKVLFGILNYSQFVNDPQSLLLSTDGNVMGGIILGALFAYWFFNDRKKNQLTKPLIKNKTKRPYELMGTIVIWAAVFGILGAKIFHNLEYWEEFSSDPINGLIAFSGLTFYGGVICGGAAVIYYTAKQGIHPLHMLDVGAPGLMLGYAVGRLGCQLSGDGDWGIVNIAPKPSWLSWAPDWMWSFNFPHNVIEEGVPIADCIGRFCKQLPLGVFPTPFYETIMASALFILIWFIRKRIRYAGMLFSIYLIASGVERFLIELIRVNAQYHAFGISFTQAELISSLMIVFGIAGIFFTKAYAKKRPQTMAPNLH